MTVLISATGSGKTLAYLLPLVKQHYQKIQQNIKDKTKTQNQIEAIIITPTHEIAVQVHNEALRIFKDIYEYSQLTHVFTGQMELDKQLRILYTRTPNIVVCTPGRLYDLLQHQQDKFKDVKSIIIDECDRIIDQQQDLVKIMKFITQELQLDLQKVILSSATMNLDKLLVQEKDKKQNQKKTQTNKIVNINSSNLTQLQQENILDYAQQLYLSKYQITVYNTYQNKQETNQLNQSIQNIYYYTESDIEKAHMLSYLLFLYKTTTLIFMKTAQDVKQFTEIFTAIGYKCIGLHAQQSQGQRLQALEALKVDQNDTIIFATDIASRGLDISSIKLVIQFYAPQNVASFIHRAGRCCRQEGDPNKIIGVNFCLISPEDAQKYKLVDKVCFSGDVKPLQFQNINYNIFQRLQQIIVIANKYITMQHDLTQDLEKLHRLQVDSIEEFLYIINDKKQRKENKLSKFYVNSVGEVDSDDIERIIVKQKVEILYLAQQLRIETFNQGGQLQKMTGSEQKLSIINVNKRELIPLKITDNMKNVRWELSQIVSQTGKKQKQQKVQEVQKIKQEKTNPFKQQLQLIENVNVVDLNQVIAQQKQTFDETEKRETGLRKIQNKMNKLYQDEIKQKQNEIKQSGMKQGDYQKLVKELKKDYDFEYNKYGRKEFHVGRK